MIPLRDINPTEKVPVMTLSIIAACVLVFLKEISLTPSKLEALIHTYGFIPARFFSPSAGLLEKLLPIFTSMFMHGSFIHIASNMLYLWVFGNNIEDRLGHFRFLLFYVLCGVSAALLQGIANPSSTTPMIGASGAIAGTLGAYLILFPRARIVTLLIFFYFITFENLPASLVISLWFVVQFFNSLGSLAGVESGVAYLAHVGGFLAGMFLILIFPKRKRRNFFYPDDYHYF
jgi:membrane associated rhomboid family serine protease